MSRSPPRSTPTGSHGLDWLSLGFGFLLPAITSTRRCIADLAVGSVVIEVAPTKPLRQWPSWTRTWLNQREVRRSRRPSAWIAVGGVISIYALGYAYPIYLAIRSLSPTNYHGHSQGGWHLGTIIEFSLAALAAVVAALALARVAPESFWPSRSSRPWRNQISAFGAAWMATVAGSLAVSLINAIPSLHHTPPAHGSAAAWPATIDALMAGPTEEIVVLLLPLVLLRAGRLPWSVVIAGCLALRLAYHVYYGVPALGLEVWALAMIFIYLRTRAVLGMIIAHTMWDVALTVRQYWSQYVGVEVISAITVCVLLAGMTVVVSKIAHGIQHGPDLPKSSLGMLTSGAGAAVGLAG